MEVYSNDGHSIEPARPADDFIVTEVTDDDIMKTAKHRVQVRSWFRIHLGAYIACIPLIGFIFFDWLWRINYIGIFMILGWGAGVVIHGVWTRLYLNRQKAEIKEYNRLRREYRD